MLWFWAILVLLLITVASTTNIIGLPGNWFCVGAVGLYAWLVPNQPQVMLDVGLVVLIILLVLAVAGEVLEMFACSFGAAGAGGSKRGAWLSILGAVIGGIVGLFLGLPIPIVGAVIASLLLSSVGAMIGAMIGEGWKGRSFEDSFRIGHAAFWGRLAGTMGKVAIGCVMIALTALAMFVRWA